MGRMIDADKLKEYIDGMFMPEVKECIDEQPTAFDAEKAVEALKKESINVMLPNGFREPCVTLKTVETIVKAGGKHETD